MIPHFFIIGALSLLSRSALAITPDTLPAVSEQKDPIQRNITSVEITLIPSIPAAPSFTNSTPNLQGSPAAIKEVVSFFPVDAVDTKLAIVHGDIILSTVADLLRNADAVTNDTVKTRRSLSVFKTQNVWPGGVVNYKWQSENAKGLGRLEAWTEATKRWTDLLPWLIFKQFPSNDTLVDDILTLVPTVGQYACFSPIGKAYSAWSNQMMLDDQCGGAGTYTHELGHTLGLFHEHQRPDRDDYVTINCQNVWPSSDGSPADCSDNACRGYGCNFAKLAPSVADWSGPYDSLSLMHYSPYEFAQGGPAIEARPGVPTPQPHEYPTILDAKRICALYSEQCTGVCGDGIKDAGEECDDGNKLNGDGCSSTCKNENKTPPSSSSIISTSTPGPKSTSSPTPTPSPQPSSSTSIRPSSSPVSSPSPSPNPNPGTCSVSSCNPWSASSCDITTSCSGLGGATQGGRGQFLCACRHGYRASRVAANDNSVQVRLPWAEQGGRVWVKPGTVCDQLCDDWQLGKDGCREVKEVAACY